LLVKYSIINNVNSEVLFLMMQGVDKYVDAITIKTEIYEKFRFVHVAG